MKNIYEDDSFNKESKDIFSKTSYDLIKEFNQMKPEKPNADISIDFTQNIPTEQVSAFPADASVQASGRQAPPPIKKTAPVVPPAPAQPQTPPSAYYTPAGAYPQGYPVQPGAYPHPVFYPGNAPQPVPVFLAPGQPPYQAYPQGYPVQPVAYPVAPGAYPQPPVYPQSPVVQQPAPSVQDSSSGMNAGTRVLFQSPDFDKKEDADEGYDSFPHNYMKSAPAFDISEVELPSRKRAGSSDDTTPSFVVDEMEIGTFELNAMSLNRTSKVTGVDAPVVRPVQADPDEPLINESLAADINAETEHKVGIFPREILEDAEEETQDTVAEEAEKDKKLPANEIIRRAILAISLIAIVVSGGMLYNEYRLHKQNENLMNDISDLIISDAPAEPSGSDSQTTTAASQETTKKDKNNKTTTKPTTTKFLTPSEQFELLKKQNPHIVFPDNIQLKYAKLYAENQDFVGYLYAAGSRVDFPIVQGKDDDEYLEKDFFGNYTKYGCPFMTYRNNPTTLDMNTVIYGHNMKDGSLFTTLEQYLTLDGYKKAPVISFNTLYQDFNFKIIATIVTNIYPEDDNGYVFPYYWSNLGSTLNYTAYLNQLAQRSLYDTGVNVLPTDRLLTLSTCYDEFEDARLVVIARLVRPGESTEVNTDKAVENSNPRFPQAYYDEYGMTNPYANAYKWEIA